MVETKTFDKADIYFLASSMTVLNFGPCRRCANADLDQFTVLTSTRRGPTPKETTVTFDGWQCSRCGAQYRFSA